MIWRTGGDWVRGCLLVQRAEQRPRSRPAADRLDCRRHGHGDGILPGAHAAGRVLRGREQRAVGGLSGVGVPWVILHTFMMLGGLVGLSALLYASRFSVVQTDAGQGFGLLVITAVVVGGNEHLRRPGNGARGVLGGCCCSP